MSTTRSTSTSAASTTTTPAARSAATPPCGRFYSRLLADLKQALRGQPRSSLAWHADPGDLHATPNWLVAARALRLAV